MTLNVINIQAVLDSDKGVEADVYNLEFSDEAECNDPDCDDHDGGGRMECESFFCMGMPQAATGHVTVDQTVIHFLCDSCTLHVVRGNLAPLFEDVN